MTETPDATLYDRLGGVFAIAAAVEHFSDAVVRNRMVGQGSKNPALNEWQHPRAREASRPQVDADVVGLYGRRRAVPVRRDASR
jgi:hypothetical protein